MKITLKDIIKREEGVFIVEEIVQDILQRAGDIVYKHHIQRRVVPYAVVRAKADILAVVEWLFLEHDTGEPDVDENLEWQLDEEAHPCMIDSWARNAIPVITRQSAPSLSLPPSSALASTNHTGAPSPLLSSSSHPPTHHSSLSSGLLNRINVRFAEAGATRPKRNITFLDKDKTSAPPPMLLQASQNPPQQARRKPPIPKSPSPASNNLQAATAAQAPNNNIAALRAAERKSRLKDASSSSSLSSTVGREGLTSSSQLPVAEKTSKTKAHNVQKHEEEHERFEKLKKDIRGREYVYDHHGNVVIVSHSNPDRLSISEKLGVKVSVKSTESNSGENHAPKAAVNNTLIPKKSKERDLSESAVVYKESLIAQPPVLDTMKLASGVVVQEGNLSREGPPPLKGAAMSRKDYSKLISNLAYTTASAETLSLPTIVSPLARPPSHLPTPAWEEPDTDTLTLPYIKTADRTRTSSPSMRRTDTIKMSTSVGQGFL